MCFNKQPYANVAINIHAPFKQKHQNQETNIDSICSIIYDNMVIYLRKIHIRMSYGTKGLESELSIG